MRNRLVKTIAFSSLMTYNSSVNVYFNMHSMNHMYRLNKGTNYNIQVHTNLPQVRNFSIWPTKKKDEGVINSDSTSVLIEDLDGDLSTGSVVMPHQNIEYELPAYTPESKSIWERIGDGVEFIYQNCAPVEGMIYLLTFFHDYGFSAFPNLATSIMSNTGAPPVGILKDTADVLVNTCVLHWGSVFFMWGIVLRFLSLGPYLLAHRNMLRCSLIESKLTEINAAINKTKEDKLISSKEKKRLVKVYKQKRKMILKKHGCNHFYSLLPMITSPLIISTLMAVRHLTIYAHDINTTSFLWIKRISESDPTYVLPVICSTLFIINFELNQNLKSSGRSGLSLLMRIGARLGSFIGFFFLKAQPTAIFCYWIGSSLMGLTSSLMLRNEWIRQTLKFPPRTAISIEKERLSYVGRIINKIESILNINKYVKNNEVKGDISLSNSKSQTKTNKHLSISDFEFISIEKHK